MIKKKICLLGDEGAGKTSLASRFADESFSDHYKSTVGVKLFTKDVFYKDEEVRFVVWDMRGGVDFYKQNSYYYNGAFAHIVLADCSSAESIKNIPLYYEESRSNYLSSQAILCLSKIDLEKVSSLESDLDMIQQSCKFHSTYETSAKLGTGVREMFESLAKLAIQ